MDKKAQWYLMASGTIFLAYVANLGANFLNAAKPAKAIATLAGLMIGASITARMLNNIENPNTESGL